MASARLTAWSQVSLLAATVAVEIQARRTVIGVMTLKVLSLALALGFKVRSKMMTDLPRKGKILSDLTAVTLGRANLVAAFVSSKQL